MESYLLPQPHELSERDREDAMGAYLMMFAALAISLPLPVINLVAAIIYFYANRKKSRFIHFHALQSLISQIPTTLVNWGLVFWSVKIWILKHLELTEEFFYYLGFAGIVNTVYIIFSLIAAVKARRGQMYYFIFFGTIAFNLVFNRKSELRYDR